MTPGLDTILASFCFFISGFLTGLAVMQGRPRR